ncbi:MAG: choice-of-anchor X domain-containing protein, partial [Candidatus Sericytochromatia bacterium]
MTPPALDSDLDAEDNAAIENALNSDDLAAYMPADLIHDGGVILFRTLANREEPKPKQAQTEPVADTAEAPNEWRRVEGRKGGRQVNMRREAPAEPSINTEGRRAKVQVRYNVAGRFIVKANGREVTKQFNQLFTRTFRFKLQNDRWQLAELTPLQHESQGGRSGVDISRVAVYQGDAAQPLHELNGDMDRPIAPDRIPTIAPGASVRLEVTASQKNGAAPYVYAYVVGQTDRARLALRDDGTLGDRTAGDGIFTGTITVPSTPGLRHLGIDVLNPAAFQPAGLVRSNGLGLSFRVQAP